MRNVCDSTDGSPRVVSWFAPHHTLLHGIGGVYRDDRVDADQELDALVQRHRAVQGLTQHPVDVMASFDRDRGVEARQSAGGLNRPRDLDLVVAIVAEAPRLAAVQVDRDDDQLGIELTKVVGTTLDRIDSLEIRADPIVVEHADRQRPPEASHRFPEGAISGVLEVLAQRLDDQSRNRGSGVQELFVRRRQEGLAGERVLPRLLLHDRPHHLRGGQLVRQVGGQKSAGAYTDRRRQKS